jgi:SAM-dependent methyltransferase
MTNEPSRDKDMMRVSDRACEVIARLDADLAAGRIDEATWYTEVSAALTSAYLAFDDPNWQSGVQGDAQQWRQAREIIIKALDRDGTFLDIGCANGLLMESVARWAHERGLVIEPFGLDISPRLAAQARLRLPQWGERIFTGNVITWEPPRRFDFVRTGLEYVPPARYGDLLHRLVERFVAPGGRVILGPDSSRTVEAMQALLQQIGLPLSGQIEHRNTSGEPIRSLVWINL